MEPICTRGLTALFAGAVVLAGCASPTEDPTGFDMQAVEDEGVAGPDERAADQGGQEQGPDERAADQGGPEQGYGPDEGLRDQGEEDGMPEGAEAARAYGPGYGGAYAPGYGYDLGPGYGYDVGGGVYQPGFVGPIGYGVPGAFRVCDPFGNCFSRSAWMRRDLTGFSYGESTSQTTRSYRECNAFGCIGY